MNEFMEGMLTNDKTGVPSSSRGVLWMLAFCSVAGFLFAAYMVGKYYNDHNELPTGDSILGLFLGGTVGTSAVGAGTYFAGQYGNRLTNTTVSVTDEENEVE